jgi:hypothetical protein
MDGKQSGRLPGSRGNGHDCEEISQEWAPAQGEMAVRHYIRKDEPKVASSSSVRPRRVSQLRPGFLPSDWSTTHARRRLRRQANLLHVVLNQRFEAK